MDIRRIGLLGYDGVQALDLIGPIDAFAAAVSQEGNGASEHCYETVILGVTGKPFTAESGVQFRPHATLQSAPALDTLIIPGGSGMREESLSSRVAPWIKLRAPRIRRIASVCTGIYGLAPTGLLDGRAVTTHWRYARDLAQRYPKLKLEPNALYLKDGPFYTSAGITAGIDLALSLIEEDHGPAVALSVARELVVYFKRPGGQEQFSEPLQFQINTSDPFADLVSWMAAHLRQDLSVEALASRTHLCSRHFSRRFKSVFNTTPADFVEGLRLDEARRRLIAPNSSSIESVADSVGFSSADSFRRAFERRFGVTPSSYRSRFAAQKRTPASRTRTAAYA
jgi:transcriptional regulator GlxA family with amidase domain